MVKISNLKHSNAELSNMIKDKSVNVDKEELSMIRKPPLLKNPFEKTDRQWVVSNDIDEEKTMKKVSREIFYTPLDAGNAATGPSNDNDDVTAKKNEWSDNDIVMTKEAQNRVGLYPITYQHISSAYKAINGDKPKDDIETLLRVSKYSEARVKAAADFLDIELDMKDISIRDVKMANNVDSCILWMTTELYNIKKMFIRAVYRKSRNIRVMNYFPPQLWERKRTL